MKKRDSSSPWATANTGMKKSGRKGSGSSGNSGNSSTGGKSHTHQGAGNKPAGKGGAVKGVTGRSGAGKVGTGKGGAQDRFSGRKHSGAGRDAGSAAGRDVGPSGGNNQEKRLRLSDDLLWGIHPVWEGLTNEPERFSEIILAKDKRGTKFEEIIELARNNGVKISFVDTLKLTGEGGSQARHQGVAARRSEAPLLDFAELLDRLRARVENGEKVRVMVCDSLQDPHNLGAVIRSALASGAAAVVTTRERSAPLGGTAAKSSAGAISHIDICQVTNLVDALQQLKKIGFWVFGAVKDSEAQSLYTTDLCLPACLVVGAEGKGVRPLVRRECDVLISIPMAGELDSLNSSVAAAVILFEAMRQNMAQGQEN